MQFRCLCGWLFAGGLVTRFRGFGQPPLCDLPEFIVEPDDHLLLLPLDIVVLAVTLEHNSREQGSAHHDLRRHILAERLAQRKQLERLRLDCIQQPHLLGVELDGVLGTDTIKLGSGDLLASLFQTRQLGLLLLCAISNQIVLTKGHLGASAAFRTGVAYHHTLSGADGAANEVTVAPR